VILLCEGRIPAIQHDERAVRESLQEQIREEKTQMAVARVFEQLKEQAVVDNYLTGVRSNGIQQTSGTNKAGGVVPAAATRPAGNAAGSGATAPTAGARPAATAPRSATAPPRQPANPTR
jgi:hypothetical protein